MHCFVEGSSEFMHHIASLCCSVLFQVPQHSASAVGYVTSQADPAGILTWPALLSFLVVAQSLNHNLERQSILAELEGHKCSLCNVFGLSL